MKIWSVPVVKIETERSDKDRALFAGTRELFHSCTLLIGDYLKATVREQVSINSETSAFSCLQYLHGHGVIMKLENGKRKKIDPPSAVSRLHEDAYRFLREWIDEYDSDDGEPFLFRYLHAIPFFVSWVNSFPCIRIPISNTYMIVLRLQNHESNALVINPSTNFEQSPCNVLMAICQRSIKVDVTEIKHGGGDICIQFLTLQQFKEHDPYSVVIPENASHVFIVSIGYVWYLVFISKWLHQQARGVWPKCTRALFYQFEPTFLVSQLFIQ